MTALAVAPRSLPGTGPSWPPVAPEPVWPAVIRRAVQETPDTWTYWMAITDPEGRRRYAFRPGQFNMLYVFGVGEVPISVSSDPGQPHRLAHTIRSVGRVTGAFPTLSPGDEIGLRGPYGRPWPLREARGGDLLVVAGGLGLAPLRPALYEAFRHREGFRRVILLVGARGPEHMLFRPQLDAWHLWMRRRGIELHMTVDVPTDDWPYGDGVVTTLFDPAHIEPARTTAFVCGPEIMMRFAARGLLERGVDPARLYLSMERNMQCAVRLCGHCQWGPELVCADGPVFPYDRIEPLLEVQAL